MTGEGMPPPNAPLVEASGGPVEQELLSLADGATQQVIAQQWYRYLVKLHEKTGMAGPKAPQYQDVVATHGSMLRENSDGPSRIVVHGAIKGYSFDASSEESLHFSLLMPHGYTAGEAIAPFVHWSPVGTDTGNVVWGMEYAWIDVDETIPATTSITTTDTAAGVAMQHQAIAFSAIQGPGKQAGSVFVCRVYRDAANSDDTLTDEAVLWAAGFHTQVSGIGTGKEWPT